MEQWFKEYQLVQDKRTGEVVRLSSVNQNAACGKVQHPVSSTGYRAFAKDDVLHLKVLTWSQFVALRTSARNGG